MNNQTGHKGKKGIYCKLYMELESFLLLLGSYCQLCAQGVFAGSEQLLSAVANPGHDGGVLPQALSERHTGA